MITWATFRPTESYSNHENYVSSVKLLLKRMEKWKMKFLFVPFIFLFSIWKKKMYYINYVVIRYLSCKLLGLYSWATEIVIFGILSRISIINSHIIWTLTILKKTILIFQTLWLTYNTGCLKCEENYLVPTYYSVSPLRSPSG